MVVASEMIRYGHMLEGVCVLSSIMFFVLKKTGLFRVSAEVEEEGMDTSKHGGSAYDYGGK